MSKLLIQELHWYCLNATQKIIKSFGWNSIVVDVLSKEDKERLLEGVDNSVLNWNWGMTHFRGNAKDDGILDISLKITNGNHPTGLNAVIICKYDARRGEFAICMLENLIAREQTVLTGKVFNIALIYSTTFCDMMGLEDVIIQDPTEEAKPRYKSYGFSQVFYAPNKMSSAVLDIKLMIRSKVMGID